MKHINKFNESSTNNFSVIKVYAKKFSNEKISDRYWDIIRSNTGIFINESEESLIKKYLEVIYNPKIDIIREEDRFLNKEVWFKPITQIEHLSVKKFEDDWYVVDVARVKSDTMEVYLCDQFQGVELLLKMLSGEIKYDPKQTEW